MAARPPEPIAPARAEAIRTLFRQVPNQTRASAVVITYMVGTAWGFSSRPAIVAWGMVAAVTAAVRYAMSRAFVRTEPPDGELLGWARRYTALNVVIGLQWALSFVLFAHFEEPITVAFTMCCLYSIGAGSTSSHAYYPISLYVLVVPLFATVLVKTVATLELEWALLGAASMLYCGFVIQVCRTQARTLDEGFRIRFENVALVEALTAEKAEAENARQRAEQASLAKSQFLAAASHDLRQPLYALSLFSSSLEDLKLDSAGRDVVRRIQDSIGVMETSFEGLLDLSKLEAGTVSPRLEPVDVDALFDRISQVFGPLALERGVELRLRSDGECVLSDPVLLEQVASNLVSNALRATAKGGVLLAARPRGDRLRFEVWDTGSGIAAADLGRIFDDYVQLTNPERDRRRGLGLGLAISRRSVALLGARIDVASRLGRGSRFGFSQPLLGTDHALAPKAPTAELASLRRGDDPLLVVEDDEDVRAALCDLLARWGFAFEAEATAQAGLNHLTSGRRFGLVITDQRLPGGMTGLELLHAMRTQVPDPPPGIVVTGEVDSPLLSAAQQAGIVVLHKPVQAAKLRQLLGRPMETSDVRPA